MPVERRRRKRVLSVYLCEDIVEAIEKVGADSGLSVSRVAEILLGFQLEIGGIIENGRFLIELHRRFHRTRLSCRGFAHVILVRLVQFNVDETALRQKPQCRGLVLSFCMLILLRPTKSLAAAEPTEVSGILPPLARRHLLLLSRCPWPVPCALGQLTSYAQELFVSISYGCRFDGQLPIRSWPVP
jgi:hypothetical protein